MKNLILLVFILCGAVAIGQGSWTQLASFPGTGRHHACSFVLGDSAYVMTGSGTSDCFKYDIHAGTWTQLPAFPGGNRNFAIGFAINGKGYISCGYNGTVSLMDMWEFDPTSGNWTQKSSGPAVGRVHPAFSVVGDKVYIGQGQQNGSWSDLDDWYEYNTVTDSWTQKTSFMSLRHHAVASTISGTVYAGTGHHIDDMYDDWYSYNPINDAWQTLTSFPGNGRSAANAVSRNGSVYLFAGEDEINFARFDDFWEYNPVTNAWSTLTTFPASGRWAPFMFTHNDTIYVGAGEDEQFNTRNDLWRFDFSTAELDVLENQNFRVFPNPAKDHIYVSEVLDGETVTLYDPMGRIVSQQKVFGQQLSIQDLNPGHYTLEIRSSGLKSNFIKLNK